MFLIGELNLILVESSTIFKIHEKGVFTSHNVGPRFFSSEDLNTFLIELENFEGILHALIAKDKVLQNFHIVLLSENGDGNFSSNPLAIALVPTSVNYLTFTSFNSSTLMSVGSPVAEFSCFLISLVSEVRPYLLGRS